MGGTRSQWAPILSGVPQGSVLGPVLFICYINDMPDTVSSLMLMYADDAKVARKVSTTSDCDNIQTDLDSLQNWSKNWQMTFNSKKRKVMHLGHSNGHAQYTMKVAVFVEVISEEKDLGVWIDDKLKFTKHIGHAVAKGNQILGLIKRSFVYKDSEVIKRLFIAHVRPHLEYANVVFHPRFKKRCRTNRESSEACYKVSSKVIQHVIRKPFKGYESTIPGVPQIQR